MDISLAKHRVYAYTGGKDFDSAKPTVVFIHGALYDHSVWALQSRYLANHGYNVLALDLPGHCRSQGEPPQTVEAGAAWIATLMDALQIGRAALVGHSWGSLIALEAAAQMGARISHLALVGISFPMKVTPALLEAAATQPLQAIRLINQFSHALLAPPPSGLGPGTWVKGAALALNKRVLASNRQFNLLHRAFLACDRYQNGLQAIQQVSAPMLMILGDSDQMTPAANATALQQAALNAGKTIRVATLHAGHALTTESPDGVLLELRSFLDT